LSNQTNQNSVLILKEKEVAGAGFWGPHINHENHPHKVAIVPKWLHPVIDLGEISLYYEFQPCSSSNG